MCTQVLKGVYRQHVVLLSCHIVISLCDTSNKTHLIQQYVPRLKTTHFIIDANYCWNGTICVLCEHNLLDDPDTQNAGMAKFVHFIPGAYLTLSISYICYTAITSIEEQIHRDMVSSESWTQRPDSYH